MNGAKGVLFLSNFDSKKKSVKGNSGKEVKYDGQIKNGEPNGIGTILYQDGTNYVGEWKNGKYNGQGTYTLPNGEIYEGEWKNGERHGQGIFSLSNGWMYFGEWKNGKQHGHGTYTWTKGQEYDGEFKDVDKWNGREYDNSGINRSKYVNGVKQL